MEQQIYLSSQQERLSAVFHAPFDGKFPGVILCHGFMGNKIGQHRIFVKTARKLTNHGFAVLRFDYSGCGDSTGEHVNISLHRQIQETKDAINFMDEHPSVEKGNLTIVGLSMGGCVATMTASRDMRVKRLVIWAPVASPFKDLLKIIGQDCIEQTIKFGSSDFNGFEIGMEFVKSLKTTNPLEEIKSFKGDCCIIHGSHDTEVDSTNANIYYDTLMKGANRGNHLLKIIFGADHTFSSLDWEKQLFESTLKFLRSV